VQGHVLRLHEAKRIALKPFQNGGAGASLCSGWKSDVARRASAERREPARESPGLPRVLLAARECSNVARGAVPRRLILGDSVLVTSGRVASKVFSGR
jgi:hypothetical protein